MSDFLDRLKAAAKKAGNAMTNPDFDPDAPFDRRTDPAPPSVPLPEEPGETIALAPTPSPRTPGGASGRIPGLDFSDLPPMPDVYVPGGTPPDATVRLAGPAALPAEPVEEGRTIAYLQPRVGADPVVGWLVVVAGADRGRDFRLHAGRNFVGRSPEMHVALTNDRAVSRDRHAIVVYDPRANRFRVMPGESAGLVYRNGAPVDAPQDLAAEDEIEVGDTRLRFVPLCTEHFQWDADAAR